MDSKIDVEKILDDAISGIKADLIAHQKESPKVRRDSTDKTIRIIYPFNWNRIKPKIKASYEVWLKFWNEVNPEEYDFETVSSYFKIFPREEKETLKRYAEEYPEHFIGDMFGCVQCVNLGHNPLYKPRVKPRKPSEYGLDWKEKNELAATAAHLYVYLYRIGEELEERCPRYVKEFLDEYGIDFGDLRNDLQLKLSVKDIMSQYYGEKFKERFWQTFVVEGPISLRHIKSLRRINPKDNPFLVPLFAEFMD